MIQFLNLKNKDYMTYIIDGPGNPQSFVPGQVATATSPAIADRYVPRPYQFFTDVEKARHQIDEEALIYLTMAIPNDIYNRVDCRESAKDLWDELERQFQGSKKSIQTKLNQSINAYEGFYAKEGETLLETYNRFNMTNIQMTKDMAQEDVNDIFTTLSQHEDEVKQLGAEKKMVKDSLALMSERKKGSSSKSSSSYKSKSRKSKALLTEVTDSSTDESSTEREKRDEKREEKREGKKEETEPKYGRCYNCGKPGHFSNDCKFKCTKNSEYYAWKTMLAKKVEEGQNLMAEEENWLYKSSDDESAHFTQVCMMAKVDEDIGSSSDHSDCGSEVRIHSLKTEVKFMKEEFKSLKGKLSHERQTMLNFRDENSMLKDVVKEKESDKYCLKKDKDVLNSKISELEKDLVNLNAEKSDFQLKFEACFQERNEAYCKIKQLEDLNLKRGQTEQTLNLLTNKLQDVRFYNVKKGLGFELKTVLKRAPENLYNFDKMGSNSTKPDIQDTFVKGKVVNDDDISSCADSISSLKSVGFAYKDLNESYKTRKIEFSEFTSLFSPCLRTESTKVEENNTESQCQFDESDLETDVENQVLSSDLFTTNSSNGSESENIMNQNLNSDFSKIMTEEIFTEMMNASDPVPIIEKMESNSEVNQTSNFEKQITDLQKTIEELEDENVDLKFKLDKSSEENKELSKDIFEKGETSCNSKAKSSSSKNANKILFLVSEVKRQNGKGEREKNVKENKVAINKCKISDSDSLMCKNSNVSKCQSCMNDCTSLDKSKLLTFARKNFICKHCHDNAFVIPSIHPKSKVSRNTSYVKSASKSLTHQAKNFHAKIDHFSKKKTFHELNVKMVWKWVPKSRYEWRIKAKVDDIDELRKANKKGPILIWVPKQK
ncbi:hypothetical protein L6452_18284 [Arctium lappa]|uniref:Uncharacterized protein n=1 Tax=Arctium lappa TaxID=4217 RepID=A0ACB9C5S5_ARCLA|nr:hypothetical protein L6452_18284 [Arctium lappa]